MNFNFFINKFISPNPSNNFLFINNIFLIISLMFWITTFTITYSILNGVYFDMKSKFQSIQPEMELSRDKSNINKKDLLHLKEKLPKSIIVKSGEKNVMIITKSGSTIPLKLSSIDFKEEWNIKFSYIRKPIVEVNEVILGKSLANKNNLKIGQILTIVTNTDEIKISKDSIKKINIEPKVMLVKVSKIIDFGISFLNQNMMYMDNRGFDYYANNQKTQKLNIYPERKKEAQKIIEGILKEDPSLTLKTFWKDNKALDDSFSLQKKGTFIVFSILFILSIFTALTSLILLISTKKKEILVLYSFGIERRKIVLLFVRTIGFLISIGIIFGGIVSIVILEVIRFLKLKEIINLPIETDYLLFSLIMLSFLSLLVGIVYIVTKKTLSQKMIETIN